MELDETGAVAARAAHGRALQPSPGVLLRAAWPLLLGLQLLPVWLVEIPPMVDLPQHAAQLSMFDRMLAGDPQLESEMALNWFTPYLVGYMLTWMIARVTSLVVALKIVLSIALVGIPLSTLFVARRNGAPHWVALLAFPIAYGYAFDWGFFNFVVASPLAILCVQYTYDYMRSPTRRAGLLLALALAGLFFGHALLAGLAGLCGGLMALAASRSLRGLAARAAPLVAQLPLVVGWMLFISSSPLFETASYGSGSDIVWAIDGMRLPMLLAGLTGSPVTTATMLLGLLVLAIPLIAGARPAKSWVRYMPVLAVVLLSLFMPHQIFGTAFFFGRFSVFALPFALLALDWPQLQRAETSARALLAPAVAVVLLLSTLGAQLAVDREGADFRALMDEMPEGRRVLAMVREGGSPHVPVPVFMHYVSWYQVFKGGTVDFSFAAFFPQLIRYRASKRPPLPMQFEWGAPFDYDAHAGERYELFVVKSSDFPGPELFAESGARIRLTQRRGDWWLYRRGAALHPELADASHR